MRRHYTEEELLIKCATPYSRPPCPEPWTLTPAEQLAALRSLRGNRYLTARGREVVERAIARREQQMERSL